MEKAQVPPPAPYSTGGPPPIQPGYPAYPPPQVPGQYPTYPYDPRYGPPPQWGGYPYMPGPPSKSSSDSTVVTVVVVVLVLFLLVPVVYVLATGLSTPVGTLHPTVNLSPGSWSGGSMVISISSVSTSTLDTSTLAFQIVTTAGTQFFNGPSGTTDLVQSTNITVAYNDAGGTGASRVGPDDNIVVSAMPNNNLLHGTTFRVLQGTDLLGTTVIP